MGHPWENQATSITSYIYKAIIKPCNYDNDILYRILIVYYVVNKYVKHIVPWHSKICLW